MQNSEARTRVLDAADHLFAERGYAAVTIKDIAKAAGIHHASLYHHSPGGKEQLFIEVTERNLHRHEEGIATAIEKGGGNLHDQLMGIAEWLLSQQPMDFIRMAYSDMPAIDSQEAERLSSYAYDVLFAPIRRILGEAQERGEISPKANLGNIAGALFAAIEGMHNPPDRYLIQTRLEMAGEIIDVFIKGMQ